MGLEEERERRRRREVKGSTAAVVEGATQAGGSTALAQRAGERGWRQTQMQAGWTRMRPPPPQSTY